MLRRLAIVIYWIGFVIGGVFLLFAILTALSMFGIVDLETPVLELRFWFAVYAVLWLFIWGVGWIIRYIVTGAKGISPMAKGRDDAFADDL